MSFALREGSRSQGAPIALFLFVFGDGPGDRYAYTSSEDPVTYSGITYAPVPVTNETLTTSGTLDNASLDVRLPKDLEIARLYDGYPPSRHITLRIFLGHVGDSEFIVNFSGRVLSYKVEDEEGVFTCEPVQSAL